MIMIKTTVVRLCLALAIIPASLAESLIPAGTGAAHAEEAMIIATEGTYPPFSEINAAGEIVGFDVDIARALCNAMNTQCTIVAVEWSRIIDGLLNHEYDAIIASMSITPERSRRVAFTDRYYSTPMRFVARRGSSLTLTPEGLRNRRVGAVVATTAEHYLRSNFPTGVEFEFLEAQHFVNAALIEGRIDAALADAIVVWNFLRSPAGDGFEFLGEAIAESTDIGIALRPDEPELLQRFNRALARILADGRYDAINSRYFPFSIY